MNLNIGDIAIYGCMGICRFEGTEKRCFNGIDENDYYKFVPVKGIGNNTYYIPASSSDEKIRNLLSEKYVYNVLNKISDIEPLEINQLTNIRQFVEQSVKEGNYENIISILKYMHNKKCTYSVNGKKITQSDKLSLKTAYLVMISEFSTVLDISEESIVNLINENIEFLISDIISN